MHEVLMQKVSQFLDDELPQEDALILLQKMRSQTELTGKYYRYQAIGHAIKNDEAMLSATPNFVSTVSGRIELEPTYFLPQTAKTNYNRRSQKIAAVAASAAVLAFLAYALRPAPMNNSPLVAIAPSSPTLANAIPVNQQINDYLQAHNAGIYTNGQVDFQPYVQVTGYRQQ